MKFKRIASLLLSMVMIFTLLPVSAFAEDIPQFTGKIYAYTNIDDAKYNNTENAVVAFENGTMELSLLKGNPMHIGFTDNSGNVVADSNLLGAGIFNENYLVLEATDYDPNNGKNYITIVGMSAGTHTFELTVNGQAVDVTLNVFDDSGSGENPDDGSSNDGSTQENVYKFFISKDKNIWSEIELGPPHDPMSRNIDVSVGETAYIKASFNGSDLADTTSLNQVYQSIEGSANISAENGFITVTGTSAGRARLDLREGSDTAVLAYLIFNIVADNTPSEYASATVRQVKSNSGKVEISNVSGQYTLVEGFSVENGKLYFDTTDKTAGVYDMFVGGKQYSAVIFPSTDVSSMTARVLPVKDVAYKTGDLPVEDTGYAVTSLTPDGRLVSNPAENAAVPVYDNEIIPMYLYKTENNSVVSMADSTVYVTGQYKEFWTVERVNVSQTEGTEIIAYKITPKNVKATTAVFSPVNIVENGVITKSFHIIYSSDYGTTINNTIYGFTNNIEKFKENTPGYSVVKSTKVEYVQEQGASDSLTYYFTKQSTPEQADYVLYDEIDISSIKVSASDNTNIGISEFVVSADADNAIGFTLDVKDSSPKSEELLIEFKLKDGTTHKVYSGVTWIPQKTEGQSVTVDSEAEFLESYYNPAVTEIIVEGGNYYFDFHHIRVDITIKGAEDEEVVFYGAAGSNKPVITIEADNHGQISDIVIDGGNKTKTGILAKGNSHIYANNLTIRNCAVAVQSETAVYQYIQADNTTFSGNKIGVIIGPADGRITNCVFDGNDIAILHKALGFPSAQSRIKNNNFVNNTTDLQTEITDIISITQNYFGGGVPTVIGKIYGTETSVVSAVYYSPYYINREKTTLTADLAGAQPLAVRTVSNYTLPVDLTVNEATAFNSALFNEMKAAQDKVAVEIPVTEKIATGDTTETKITTIWGFDNDSGNIAEAVPENGMDLKVTSVPSEEAEAIVSNTVENISDIVQYVNFKHNGTLPGKATVKILASSVSDIEDLKLYYINEETGTVEEAEICAVEKAVIDGQTYYIVTVDHCSEYIITTDVIIKDNSDEDDTTGGETGGSTAGGNTGGSSGTETPVTSPSTAPSVPTATPKPSTDTSANNFVSAVEIENKLDSSSNETVKVDVSDKNYVSPKAFELLAEYPDKTLVFEGEGFSISFSAADLTEPDALGNKTFDATVSLESPNADAIKALCGDADIINVYFNHHGKLPGKAKVRLFVGTEHTGLEKYVHYFDSENNSFEFITKVVVDAEGWVEFEIYHCSDYVLSDILLSTANEQQEQLPEKEDVQQPESAPSEDKITVFPIIAAIIVIIGIAVVFLKKKNK